MDIPCDPNRQKIYGKYPIKKYKLSAWETGWLHKKMSDIRNTVKTVCIQNLLDKQYKNLRETFLIIKYCIVHSFTKILMPSDPHCVHFYDLSLSEDLF
jgi:hypothetical protein